MDETPASLLLQARELYEAGSLEKAEGLLREGTSRFPADPGIRTFHAYLLYRSGRLDEAALAYRDLAEEYPEEESHLSNLGLIYYKEKKYIKARETFEAILAIRPDDPKTLRNLGFCFRKLGNEERARECLRRAGNGEADEAPAEVRQGMREQAPPPRKEGGAVEAPEGESLASWIAEAALPLHSRGGEVLHSGRGSAVCSIDEKLYLKRRHLFSYRGVIVFSSASREARRAAEKFGDRESELMRVEGTGEIALSGDGGSLHFFHLDEGSDFNVNYGALVSHGPDIEVRSDLGSAIRGVFMAARLTGTGGFVVTAAGDPLVLEVPEDMPAFVRAGSVLGWSGDLTHCREKGPSTGGLLAGRSRGDFLLFEGQGFLVLQDCQRRRRSRNG